MVVASVATAVALVAGQHALLLHDVGVFWVLIRILVCGGIGAFGWAAWTDQLKTTRGKSVEVSRIIFSKGTMIHVSFLSGLY